MKLYDKSLLIHGDNILFDNNYIINNYRSNLVCKNPTIISSTIGLNASDIGKEIIDKFINNKILYGFISEYFNSNCCPMKVYIVKENKIDSYYLYKRNLLLTIDNFIKNNIIDINSDSLNNFKSLTNSINIVRLKEMLNNRTFTLKINNKYVNCSYNLIFNFLELNDKDFYGFFDNNIDYNGINKALFLYMVKEFYRQYSEGYFFDNDITEKINYIEQQDNIELVVYDKKFVNEPDHSIYRNIEIDQEFKNKVLSTIPINLSKLEIVLYIYIKLCKELNYDLEYYAVRQKGPIAEAHKDISKVKEINLNNNNCVCYEFNAIFAYFLNEFNIDFEVRFQGEKYGDTHAWLRVNVDNLLISFDSMHRIFWEFDLLQAKINNPLKGVKLYNKNKIVSEKFNTILDKVYRIVIKEENKDNDIKIDRYSDIIRENNLSSFEKLSLIVEKTQKLNLSDIESIAYLLNMHKLLSKEENDEIIEKELLLKKVNNELKLCILFTSYNKYSNKQDRQYTYSLYIPNEAFRRYDGDTLKFFLEQGIYEVYEKNIDVTIPGIDYISKKEIDFSAGRIR